MTGRDDLISWLNDAYAMELSIIEVLDNHAKDAEKHPDLQTRIQHHLRETQDHAERVKTCIQSLGGSVSQTKAIFADLMGRVQGMSTGMFADELVKNMLRDYMTEHLEIASYTSLMAAAEEMGQTGVINLCRGIIEEERRMAQWLEQQIPEVTKLYLKPKLQAESMNMSDNEHVAMAGDR